MLLGHGDFNFRTVCYADYIIWVMRCKCSSNCLSKVFGVVGEFTLILHVTTDWFKTSWFSFALIEFERTVVRVNVFWLKPKMLCGQIARK